MLHLFRHEKEHKPKLLSPDTILTETITSENKYKFQDLGFLSVELQKRKRNKISGILFLFASVACCCGLCVPNMTIAKANAKEIWGNLFAFPLRKRKQKKISRFSFVIVSVRMVFSGGVGVFHVKGCVPRNQGNQSFVAGYPGILPGYPGGARKIREKKLCSILVPYLCVLSAPHA